MRISLMCTFVLIDSRHPPQVNDLEFMEFLGENGIPFCMVFTKADKLKQSEINKNLKRYEQKMLEIWEEMPNYFVTSSTSGSGTQELLDYIGDTNQLWVQG